MRRAPPLIAVCLILAAVAPLAAAPRVPCKIGSDPTMNPDCGESRGGRGPRGSYVVTNVGQGGGNATAYYGGRAVSTASFSRGVLNLDGFSIRRDGTRVVIRDNRNGSTSYSSSSASDMAALRALLRRYNIEIGWWEDLMWALRAGWASTACNIATLEAMGAATAFFACIGTATITGGILAGCMLVTGAAYFRALERQSVDCDSWGGGPG